MAARRRPPRDALGCPSDRHVCRSCGRRLRRGARFCDGCGVRLDIGSWPAEHADVTVMFADVVGSMQLAAAMGPDRFWDVIVEIVRRCTAVLHEHGAVLDAFTGDGVMAVFGAPVVSEHHAFRACLAALDIQREVRRFAEEVERVDGRPLRLRVGLNSGRVLFGAIGAAAVGHNAIGEDVGFAQRMESVAPPGGVLVSESTARLVDGVAVLGPFEMVHVKGVDAPVPARRLLAVERPAPAHPTSYGWTVAYRRARP